MGHSVPRSFRTSRLSLTPVLILTVFLAACSGAVPSIPTSTPQADQDPAAHAELPSPRPNAVIQFQHISLEDGLSQSVVNVILQDRRGFLWFGTQDGLNRYDGYNFKVYKPDPEDPNSISDGWIEALYEDRDGYLWVGTYQGGLNRYDPKTDTFTQFRHIPEEPSSIGEGMICAILQDRSGTLWVGGVDGLSKFNPESNSFTHYRNDPKNPGSLSHNDVHVIYQDSMNRLWIGTLGGGLELFDPIAEKFTHFRANSNIDEVKGEPEILYSISDNYIKDITEDEAGYLWVGTEEGLNRFNPSRRQFKHYLTVEKDPSTLSSNSTSALLLDQQGSLWVGTDYGLNRLNRETGKFTRYFVNPLVSDSLSANTISSLYEDHEGILWVGTWGGGINKHSPAQEKFALYRYNPDIPEEGFPSEGIFGAAAGSSGIAWFGSAGGGLTRFDSTNGLSTRYTHAPEKPQSLASQLVWVVYRDRAGVLWVGTSEGLDRFNETTGRFFHHKADPTNPETSLRDNFVTQIYESPTGTFWVGTGEGLDQFDRKSKVFTHITDPSNPEGAASASVAALLEDRDGFLWVGTSGKGLYRLDQKKSAFRYYQTEAGNPASLSSNIVLDIYQDDAGVIWLATSRGLNKYDPQTDSFSSLTERDGLPNNFIYCIIPDENETLWLTTNFGLSHFDPRAGTFQNYTVSDGLQSNEFNSNACARSENGDIYVGGTFGVNVFTPSEIPPNHYKPPIVLTSLTQGEHRITSETSVEDTRELTLKWPANAFEFEFAVLSFAEPRKNQYAYVLDGFDTDWNEIGNKHEGRYTNLPGGEYILRLKGSNNDGVWSEDNAALKITVVPPFWQTWWFFTLSGLVIITAVWGGYRLRIRSIEARRQELERQVAERTREIERLFEQMKELAIVEERNRLARELHDSAKQKAFAALAQIGAANGLIQRNTAAAQNHIREAENLVHDVIQELTFLIQEMYPMALKEKGLVLTLREYVYEWESRSDIKAGLRVEGDFHLPLKVEQSLYRITQETLANTARHSHAVSVDMALVYDTNQISLSIADDGCGFDVDQKPKGVGLRSIRERAESVGGKLILESKPGNGTRIEVIIPVEQPQPLQGVQS
jgi:ligand-binding sensor domain-containing protein/signal transduction histidine kinase